jgi:hypothetical protein
MSFKGYCEGLIKLACCTFQGCGHLNMHAMEVLTWQV